MIPATVLSTPQEVADLVTPGVLGFLIIFAIAAALYFLLRNMITRLRRFDAKDQGDDSPP